MAGGRMPVAVAVGIYRPSAPDAGVRSVVCTSWESRAAADDYANRLPSALATGASSVAGPFAELYTDAEIEVVGGDQHVVRLTADTGSWRDIVFQSLRNGELPGLQT